MGKNEFLECPLKKFQNWNEDHVIAAWHEYSYSLDIIFMWNPLQEMTFLWTNKSGPTLSKWI